MEDLSYPKVYLYRRIVQAKIYMDNNYSNNIDLNNIADEAFFSKFHFIRLFKKSYGKTPHHYLTSVRIENAAQLLASGLPVNEVCFAVGFESISSFTGLFKRLSGITPAAFQQRQAKIRAEISETPLKFIPNCYAEMKGWTKKSNFEEEVN